jgi:hypothetical protein
MGLLRIERSLVPAHGLTTNAPGVRTLKFEPNY